MRPGTRVQLTPAWSGHASWRDPVHSWRISRLVNPDSGLYITDGQYHLPADPEEIKPVQRVDAGPRTL